MGVTWIALAALSGALLALCSPPFDAVPLVWIGLAGLAVACAAELPPRRAWVHAAARGLAFGAGANLVALRFVPAVIVRFTPLPLAVGALALVLLSLAQGLPWAVAALIHRALARRRVPRAAAFALGVYAAGFVPMIFPWTPAGGV